MTRRRPRVTALALFSRRDGPADRSPQGPIGRAGDSTARRQIARARRAQGDHRGRLHGEKIGAIPSSAIGSLSDVS